MPVQGAGRTGEKGRQHKDHQLVPGNVNTDRFRGNAVIPDSHNSPALFGTLQVHHDQYGKQYQNDGIGQQRFGVGIDGVGIKAQRAAGQIQVGNDIFDDLAAGQGYDGQIVAFQAQGGQADDQAKERSDQTAAEHGKGQADRHGQYLCQCDGDKAAGKQTHRHKPGMAQRKFTQQAYNEVERDRQHNVDRNGDEHIGDLTGKMPAVQQIGDDPKGNSHQQEGQKIAV